ncbi:carbohydrate ABC transporter permease [Blautia sp. Marseille-P3201T]|uniref:carbohydrate ABC transporter permease n=1 Tax=Blautia sp. Marseille-P3201T TaxID=1907659 RepID=UPI001FA92590|nr:sugar ABC transporter permease [Blautia sp. Marseille-P3201T]
MKYISTADQTSFIGLGNYFEMIYDAEFRNAFKNSIIYSVCFVPLVMVVGLLLAVLVNQKIYFRNGIRAMIFMPYVSNMVAIAIVWSLLLDPVDGIINQTLRALGVSNAPMWLMGSKTALITVVMIAVWREVGLQFVTYLAALQDVPKELKEAAQIDGANRFQLFRFVTFPLLKNTTFLLIITSIITSLKNFTIIQVLTEGGPGNATTVLPLKIVDTAFSSARMGYASAQAMVMFVLVMVITAVQWIGKNRSEIY